MTLVNKREWTCPHCGGNQLMERATDMVVESSVEEVTVDEHGFFGFVISTEGQVIDDGGGSETFLYCDSCGKEVTGESLEDSK